MASAAAFASSPAIQRRRPFGISIAGRRAAIASRAFPSGVRRWERSAAEKADDPDRGADEDAVDSSVPAARATSKTLAGGDDPSLTFADHRRMCRAVQRCKNSDEVLALAASSLASWNHVTLAAAFVALASNARTKSSLGTLLCSESYARMEEKAARASVPALGARGVVNILHSVATLHRRHRRFFDVPKSLPKASLPAVQSGFNPSPHLALALDAAVERTAGHMRPKEVAAALWSYAALDAAPLAPTLASSLTLAAARVLAADDRATDHQGFALGAGAREVAGIATALAKLGVTLAVVDAGARGGAGDGNRAVTSSRESNPTGTATSTGGSALNATTRRGCRTPRFGGGDVSGDTTWEMLIIVAAATAAERDATAALHPAITRCAGEMTGQGAMNALWAYAEMAPRGFEPPTNGIDRGDPIHSAVDALYARLTCLATASNGADPIRNPSRNLNPAEAAGAFAACAKIKTRALVPDAPAATVRALCETASETAEKMSAKEAANCAWARARFDSADDDARLETTGIEACALLDDAIVRTAPRMNGRDVATVLWAYDALREGELRRLDGGREAWDAEAVQVGGGVGRFPRSVADRAGMFAVLDAALARTLPRMNGAELAQTPSCWRHRVEELREELGLRSVPAEDSGKSGTLVASAAADDDDDDDDVVVKV